MSRNTFSCHFCHVSIDSLDRGISQGSQLFANVVQQLHQEQLTTSTTLGHNDDMELSNITEKEKDILQDMTTSHNDLKESLLNEYNSDTTSMLHSHVEVSVYSDFSEGLNRKDIEILWISKQHDIAYAIMHVIE